MIAATKLIPNRPYTFFHLSPATIKTPIPPIIPQQVDVKIKKSIAIFIDGEYCLHEPHCGRHTLAPVSESQ